MTSTSFELDEKDFRGLETLAERTGLSVDRLIREAISEYLGRRRKSIFDIHTYDGGKLLNSWTREELMDEMLDPDPS